jgi:hypothetical protein
MRQIKDDDGQMRSLHLGDIAIEFEEEVRDIETIDDAEYNSVTSQYAYIKFGLVLQKVRNQCTWKKCAQKFADFRAWCEQKVKLNIWQVSNAIKSARVAMQLAWLGFTDLPRNASQALKLADLSIERLGEVWGNVLKNCQGHKITALAIEEQIDPDKQRKTENLRLPRAIAERLRQQALEAGLTLAEYLDRLSGEAPIEETEPPTAATELNEEQLAIIDRVEYQWLKPRAEIFETFARRAVCDSNRLMSDLVGNLIPRVRVAHE